MKKILIIEDEIIIAQALAMDLEDWGFDIIGIAPDYLSAINLVQEGNPHFIISDINLKSKESGIDVARWVNNFNTDIEVIFMTGYGYNTLKQQLESITYKKLLEKPVDARAVLRIIQ